jgi:hypothetical protein
VKTGSEIPQPAGWGSFTSAYKGKREGPFRNPPTGRLGIFHVSLQGETRRSGSQIPQTESCSFKRACKTDKTTTKSRKSDLSI